MEVKHTHKRRRITYNNAGTFQADKGNKKTDAGGNGKLETGWNCIDYHVTKLRK